MCFETLELILITIVVLCVLSGVGLGLFFLGLETIIKDFKLLAIMIFKNWKKKQ